MALGTNHVTLPRVTAASRTRSNSAFVRELWADEIIASQKVNVVLEDLVHTMNHNKKKGDTVHVPRPVRGDASQKAAETQVTLIANQEGKNFYVIDQHWEYSRLIEDIVSIQAEDSIRPFYTDDAGYALARRKDTFLWDQVAKLAGSDASPTAEGSAYSKAVAGTPSGGALVTWDPSANTNEGNAGTITDEGMRLLVQELDDNNTPSMGRCLVVPPVEKRKMLGIDRQIVFDQVGEAGSANKIRNGYVGPLYGADVIVSTHAPVVEDDGTNSNDRAAVYFQKDALIFISQLDVRTQTQYKQEYLADLFTADILFGGGVLRPESGIAIVVPA